MEGRVSGLWEASRQREVEEVITMGKPSKASLSKAGRTLASDGSSKTAKSKAGSTLGKG